MPNLDELLAHLTFKHSLDFIRDVDLKLDAFRLSDLSCSICGVGFKLFKNLLSHVRKKHSKEAVTKNSEAPKSSVKVKKIRSNLACLINMSTALPFKYFMNKFRCFYCSKDFVECHDMKEHLWKDHPRCDVNHSSMKLRGLPNVCIKIDIHNLKCKICSELLTDLNALINHLTSKHKAMYDTSVDSKIQTFKLVKDCYPCTHCPEKDPFRYFGELLKHMNKVHPNNNLICLYCGISFRSDWNLRTHTSLYHRPEGYKCSDCDLEFTTKLRLKNHRAKVHGQNVVECPECPQKFPTTYQKQIHMINAHNLGSKCKFCDRMFVRNSFLQNHISRVHLKEKKAKCNICHKIFFDKVALKIHMVKHVGNRNFQCDICGKKFLWKKNLIGHMTSHGKMNRAPKV